MRKPTAHTQSVLFCFLGNSKVCMNNVAPLFTCAHIELAAMDIHIHHSNGYNYFLINNFLLYALINLIVDPFAIYSN